MYMDKNRVIWTRKENAQNAKDKECHSTYIHQI